MIIIIKSLPFCVSKRISSVCKPLPQQKPSSSRVISSSWCRKFLTHNTDKKERHSKVFFSTGVHCVFIHIKHLSLLLHIFNEKKGVEEADCRRGCVYSRIKGLKCRQCCDGPDFFFVAILIKKEMLLYSFLQKGS